RQSADAGGRNIYDAGLGPDRAGSWAAASPVSADLHGLRTRILLGTAAGDRLVPPAQMVLLASALRPAGAPPPPARPPPPAAPPRRPACPRRASAPRAPPGRPPSATPASRRPPTATTSPPSRCSWPRSDRRLGRRPVPRGADPAPPRRRDRGGAARPARGPGR